jgi:hypothetical protein
MLIFMFTSRPLYPMGKEDSCPGPQILGVATMHVSILCASILSISEDFKNICVDF